MLQRSFERFRALSHLFKTSLLAVCTLLLCNSGLADDKRVAATLGAAVHRHHNANDDLDQRTQDLSWAFVTMEAITPAWRGIYIEANGLAIATLSASNADLRQDTFTVPADLRTLALTGNSADGEFGITLGRDEYPDNPALDGDRQQGIGLRWGREAQPTWNVLILNRWINHDTESFDADGISGWVNVNQANAAAGDVFISAQLTDWNLTPWLSVSPFVNFQERVLGVVGSTLDTRIPITGSRWSWNTEIIAAYYQNRVPKWLEPDFDDVWSGRIHTAIASRTASVGIGVYWIGNRANDTGAGLFDDFDPMQEDNLYPFNSDNDFKEIYVDGQVQFGKLSVQSAIAVGRNRAVDADSLEFDLFFQYQISKTLTVSGYADYVTFSNAVLPNFTNIGTSVSYAF